MRAAASGLRAGTGRETVTRSVRSHDFRPNGPGRRIRNREAGVADGDSDPVSLGPHVLREYALVTDGERGGLIVRWRTAGVNC
jgi:hypothetical protein